ncbi:uncharacterized protein LOC115156354 isoform X2 [Salmo trutta]|uniref:uncharacterized protein LOC115156354 isoform X2 n=1 Tax=Salmo trutta TaxID=8032 RepID=UPI0011306211|nr:uncharacterized protein LOC115156354 isoform X2 [Salmo trutta]
MAEHSEAVSLTPGKMLLLFLCLGLVTSNVQSRIPGVNVTCENQSVVAGQNHNLTCRVDYRDADQNKTGCKTELYFWKHKSKTPIRICTTDCNITITTKTYFFEIKNVSKADEGNYTFFINTVCGNGNGTLNVKVTLRNEKPQTEMRKQGSSRHIIVIIITVLGVLLFLIASGYGRRLMGRLKFLEKNDNVDKSPEATREALNLEPA